MAKPEIGVKEAAKRSGLSRAWIKRLCQQRRLRARKPAGPNGINMPWLICLAGFKRYQRERQTNPPKRGPKPAA